MEENTHFAPAERSTSEDILNEYELIASQKLFSELFGAITGIGAIINKNRQIVYSNTEFLDFIGLKSLEPILGKRSGEILSCIHSGEEKAGCGTSMSCKYCGAVNAVLESQISNQKAVREASISSEINGKLVSRDLKITSTPILFANQVYYVLSLQDISNEKRIVMIEKIFFHDLLNTASGLNGLLTILKMGTDPEEARELISKSEEASQNLIEEVMIYRQLRAAENGDIQVSIEKVNSLEFLVSAIERIGYHEAGLGKQILIEENALDTEFQTDRILFRRVLINILKNALEATPQDDIVMTGIEDLGDKIRFWVKNSGLLPESVQLQIFQRSFSTKGIGRGIGTYSIRLLTENYLKGKVSFFSNETQGTVFSVVLNKYWL